MGKPRRKQGRPVVSVPLAVGERMEGRIVSAGEKSHRRAPLPSELKIELPDGRILETRHEPREDEQRIQIGTRWAYERLDFDRCPICLTSAPTSEEHVPPESIGGRVMTLTCTTCNTNLGSKVEAELRAWYLDAQIGSRASGSAAPGRRRLPPIYRRLTQDGQLLWFVDGDLDPAVREMLASGNLNLEFRPPHMPIVRVAALKQAYLGACIALREIPQGVIAEQIRAELLAVRDANDAVEAANACAVAASVQVARAFQEPSEQSVVVAYSKEPANEGWVVLAGVVAVSWPLPDQLPTD